MLREGGQGREGAAVSPLGGSAEGAWRSVPAAGRWHRTGDGPARAALRPEASALPAWPFVVAFAGYILWWVLGIGDMIWPVMALVMLALMARRRGLDFPRGWSVWAFFLVWAAVSIVECDTSGRVVGALYRLSMLLAATVFACYAYNARRTLTLRVYGGTMTWFLLSTVLGGYLAMLAPNLQIDTPLSHVLPGALTSNSFIHDFVHRSTTQWDQNAWIRTDPRPSAPFVYANTWGNVYSLILPVVLAHAALLRRERSPRRWPVAALVAVSIVPAAATQNRGMFVGLGVVALWVGLQRTRSGRLPQVLAGAAVVVVAALVWFVSPMGQSLLSRVRASTSTGDRLVNYVETLSELRGSPLLGFGAPRPAAAPWLPSLGTQGQFWTVLFSHGVVGAVLFMGTFAAAVCYAWRCRDLVGAVLGGIALATLVESFYYGMTTGMMVSLVAVALLVRWREGGGASAPSPQVSTSDRRGSSLRRSSRSRWSS